MITLIKWAIILAALAGLFIYFGGGGLLKDVGQKSVEVGDKLEKVEKKMEEVEKQAKDFSKDVKKKAGQKLDKLKDELD